MKKKIFTRLKPKLASLGFNREELMGIAAGIADKLDSDEATDEDIDAEIDAVLPYLKVGQQFATRLSKKPSTTKTGDEDEEDEEDASATVKPSKKGKQADEEPEWFKSFREQQEARIAKLEGEKITTSRKVKLEALLKDSGSFGARALKAFSRMNFDSDEDFEEYFEEVESDLEAYNQERADAGLATVSKPLGKGDKDGKPKVMTDAEIDALVNQIH